MGATASILISIVINTIGGAVVSASFGPDLGTVYGLVISAPFVEEISKAIVLFAIFFFGRNEFNGLLDGIVYAAMVGLGFSTVENILYYGRFVAEGGSLGEIFFIRGIQSPFAHPLFTSMTGLGLALAANSSRTFAKFAAPLGGLALAILLHAIWNGSAVLEALGIVSSNVVYLLFFVPVLLGLIALVVVAGRVELRHSRTYLQHDVRTGLLPEHEPRVLSSAGERRRAVRAAGQTGSAAKRARKRFHRVSTELALHRHKVATGSFRGAHADQDDLAYQHEIRGLLPQFGVATVQAGGAAQPAVTQGAPQPAPRSHSLSPPPRATRPPTGTPTRTGRRGCATGTGRGGRSTRPPSAASGLRPAGGPGPACRRSGERSRRPARPPSPPPRRSTCGAPPYRPSPPRWCAGR